MRHAALLVCISLLVSSTEALARNPGAPTPKSVRRAWRGPLHPQLRIPTKRYFQKRFLRGFHAATQGAGLLTVTPKNALAGRFMDAVRGARQSRKLEHRLSPAQVEKIGRAFGTLVLALDRSSSVFGELHCPTPRGTVLFQRHVRNALGSVTRKAP